MRRSERLDFEGGAAALLDLPPTFARERRLHARLHRYWSSLRAGRRCPAIGDLDPAELAGGADRGVLFQLEETGRWTIGYLGRALAEEARARPDEHDPARIDPSSLLGALIRRLPAVRHAAAPRGLEAELLDAGDPKLYRGILLPFAAGGDEVVRFIYGIVDWKLVFAGDPGDDIVAAVASAMGARPGAAPVSAWGEVIAPARAPLPPASPAQRLAEGRTWVALAAAGEARRATSLHAALSAAYDLLLAADQQPDLLGDLAEAAGIAPGRGATFALHLVFGQQPRAEQAICLRAIGGARRLRLARGQMASWLDHGAGGLAAAARAEAEARRERRTGGRRGYVPVERFLLAPLADEPEKPEYGTLRLAVG